MYLVYPLNLPHVSLMCLNVSCLSLKCALCILNVPHVSLMCFVYPWNVPCVFLVVKFASRKNIILQAKRRMTPKMSVWAGTCRPKPTNHALYTGQQTAWHCSEGPLVPLAVSFPEQFRHTATTVQDDDLAHGKASPSEGSFLLCFFKMHVMASITFLLTHAFLSDAC